MKKYAKLLRVEQWVKNLFVFIPVFFSGNLHHPELLIRSVIAFIAFSSVASMVYIINDYSDRESDRNHPTKKFRPLAAGTISLIMAKVLLLVLGIIAISAIVVGGYLYDMRTFDVFTILGVYFVMNLAYTFRLKHVPIVDICIIAIGFVLRVFVGGYATGLVISKWAILLTFVLALVLAVGKRRGELINAGITGKTRKALDGYNIQFADIALSISVTLAIVCYVMFTLSPENVTHYPRIFYTVIFVFFALLRYLQQTLVFNKTESPTKIIYKDRYIQITLILWVGFYLYQIYIWK